MMRAEQVRFRDEKPSAAHEAHRPGAGQHRPGRQAQHRGGPAGQQGHRHTRVAGPQASCRRPSASRRRAGPAALHPHPVLHLVPEATRRPGPANDSRATAALFPTCIVEYQSRIDRPGPRRRLRAQRHRVRRCPRAQVCCGAPFLHQGDVERFRKNADKNIHVLAEAIRDAEAKGEDAHRRGAPAHLRLRPQERLRRLRRRARRRAGGRAHRWTLPSTSGRPIHKGDDTELDLDFPRRGARVHHLPRALSPPSPERRPARAATC